MQGMEEMHPAHTWTRINRLVWVIANLLLDDLCHPCPGDWADLPGLTNRDWGGFICLWHAQCYSAYVDKLISIYRIEMSAERAAKGGVSF